jgi:hypothetical protein
MAYHERRVVVDEPGLSEETNRAITEDVRAAVGGDIARVPEDSPRPRVPRRRSRLVATLTENRLILIITFLMFLVVGAIVSLAVGSWWILLAVVAVHAVATVLMTAGVLQATADVERPDQATLERMEAEGVPDPEGTFNEMVEQFGGADAARSDAAEVISPTDNERTAGAQEEPGRAAADQRSALTPGSLPERSGGDSSIIAALPWYVVGALVVTSIAFAIAVGGRMWIAPVLMVVLGGGWIAVDRLLDKGRFPRRIAPAAVAIVALAVAVVAVVLVVFLA